MSNEISEVSFDEQSYLQRHPDVAEAIQQGAFKSGWEHYHQVGWMEMRQLKQPDPEVAPAPAPKIEFPPCFLDSVLISRSGAVLIIGWIDDHLRRITSLSLSFTNGSNCRIEPDQIARIRRSDVEAALGGHAAYPYGFWAFNESGAHPAQETLLLSVELEGGLRAGFEVKPRLVEDREVHHTALEYIASADHFGNRYVQGLVSLGKRLANSLAQFNRQLSQSFCAQPYVVRFGSDRKDYKGSIIVCLYGKAEYMFLQNALFARLAGIQDYEFIYVSNSPELSEQLMREAKIGHAIYGIDQTVVLLTGNAGFGAANNIAAKQARSNRLLIVNPDVFPYDSDWAQRHTELIATRPEAETRMFGVPLYYDDGSLMHGGMYFDVDVAPSFDGKIFHQTSLIRVEHFGKGAQPNTPRHLKSRPVPAVTGAFISVDRAWFEELGGFTEDFVFGHYEDADLCLKSLTKGYPAWMHDIKLWHLEGKGSTRLLAHEGGSLVNRLLFSQKWGDLIEKQITGSGISEEQLLGIARQGHAPAASDVPASPQAAIATSPLRKVSTKKSTYAAGTP